jgi:hypothetical protein
MNELIITLTGEITSSNFDEWKQDLIQQIQSVNKSLTSDADFAAAVKHVKQFKAAEQSLKEAKQSALQQAADIQKLFAAIDEVSEEARQARLTLERQIKVRKEEIKEAVIVRGIETVQALIDAQSDDFRLINHTGFLDRDQFEEAMKRRTSIVTMEKAADELCASIEQAITQKAAELANNATAIDSLTAGFQPAFQDRSMLLALPSEELNRVIDQRLESFKADQGDTSADKSGTTAAQADNDELNLDFSMQGDSAADATMENFNLTMKLRASNATAQAISDAVKQQYADNEAVLGISLSRPA